MARGDCEGGGPTPRACFVFSPVVRLRFRAGHLEISIALRHNATIRYFFIRIVAGEGRGTHLLLPELIFDTESRIVLSLLATLVYRFSLSTKLRY